MVVEVEVDDVVNDAVTVVVLCVGAEVVFEHSVVFVVEVVVLQVSLQWLMNAGLNLPWYRQSTTQLRISRTKTLISPIFYQMLKANPFETVQTTIISFRICWNIGIINNL